MAGLRKLTTYKKQAVLFPRKAGMNLMQEALMVSCVFKKSYSPSTTSPCLNQYFGLAEPTLYQLISIIPCFPMFLCQYEGSQHQVPGTPRRDVHFAVSPPGHSEVVRVTVAFKDQWGSTALGGAYMAKKS